METNLVSLVESLELPSNVINVNVERRELSSEDNPYSLSLRRSEIADEKDLNRFIKACEGMIRHSSEYHTWTQYVKETMGHYTCAVTGEVNAQVQVEIHHHPVGLFAVVKGIINEHLVNGREFCSFDIALKVIEMHYENRIPFIPLCSTMHQKFHNGFLNLPIELVIGDKDYFYVNYSTHLDEDEINSINSRLSINFQNCGWSQQDGYVWQRDQYAVQANS